MSVLTSLILMLFFASSVSVAVCLNVKGVEGGGSE